MRLPDGLTIAGEKIPRLREANGAEEQLKILKRALENNATFLAWDTFEGERSKVEATLKDATLNASYIKVDITLKESIPGQVNQVMYLYTKENFVLFKATVIRRKGLKVCLRLEDSLMVEDKREFYRQTFKSMDVKAQISTYDDHHEVIKKNIISLLDISEKGMGFKISADKALSFWVDQCVALEEINELKIPAIEGKILYLNPSPTLAKDKKQYIRVGVVFNERSSLISEVIKVVKG